jgi:Na+-transporting methylmalonyl-CoA/oxaloacetate decarboxylase gamma subunit
VDVSLTGGSAMAVIGVGTVFIALTVLLAAVRLTSRILNRPGAPAPLASAGGLARDAPAVRPDTGDDLEYVALAAYALHLARRARTSVPGPPSRWMIAGRLRQTAPFQGQESAERWLPTR